MAESIGTTALFIVVDSAGVKTGIDKAKAEYQGFVHETQRTGEQISGAFTSARDKVGQIFSDLKSFKFGDALTGAKDLAAKVGASFSSQAASGLTEGAAAAGAFSAKLTAVATAAGIGAVAFGAIALGLKAFGDEARRVSTEMDNIGRSAERLGTTGQGLQTTFRFLQRGGLDPSEAEFILNRFRDFLGQVRRNPTGEQAQTLERLGLNPQRLTELDTADAFRNVIEALHNVTNSYDQAALSQDIFQKRFQDLQRPIALGGAGVDQAASFVNRFGDTEEMIARARETEDIWRRLARSSAERSGQMTQDWRDFTSRVSNRLAHAAESFDNLLNKIQLYARYRNLLLTGSFTIPEPPPLPTPPSAALAPRGAELEEIGNLLANGPRVDRVSDIDTQVNTFLRGSREAIRFSEQWRDELVAIGAASADSSREELDALRGLIEERDRLIAKGLEGAQLEAVNANIVERARTLERERARQIFDDLSKRLEATRDISAEAQRLGFVQAGATRAELDAVRPLLDARQRLARITGGFTGLLGFDAVARTALANQANNRIEDLARQWFDAAGAIGQSTEQMRLFKIAEEEARVAAMGIFGVFARDGLNALRRANDQLTRAEELDRQRQRGQRLFEETRTPLEKFNEEVFGPEGVIGNLTQSQDVRERAIAARFRQLEQSLGQGPSSFAVTAPTFGTLEGARFLADLQIRQRTGVDDPQRRVERVMDAVRRAAEQQVTESRNIVRAIEAAPRTQPAPPI